jgi:predicted RNA-binding protein with PUA-like domain
MAYWLFKSEPSTWSWDQQKGRGAKGEPWEGVRNYQARNNMRAMKLGDLGFFYHSNQGLEIVGIVEVSKGIHPDAASDDPRWECVDIKALLDLPKPVRMADIKANPKFENMVLVNNSRLSVQPVGEDEWLEICRMGGLADPPRSP